MILSIIAAMGKHREIGLNGVLPWHFKDELRHFKKITMGNTLLFGRVSFENLGNSLSGRKKIVVSRTKRFETKDAETFYSIEGAIISARESGVKELFICGGEKIFQETIDLVDRIYLSEVSYDGIADCYFPSFIISNFIEKKSVYFEGENYTFKLFVRREDEEI